MNSSAKLDYTHQRKALAAILTVLLASIMLGTLVVPAHAASADFSISANPSNVKIVAGSFGTTTITAGSLNGFSSAVDLSNQPAAGFVVSFSPNPITPSSGGSATSKATINVSGLVTPGNYTITMVGTSGSLSHSTNVIITVSNPPPPPTSKLTARTFDSNNNEILGYYTVLYLNGQAVTTGFSPTTFTVNSGDFYVIQVQDYKNFVFDHWQDTGSTTRDRTISISTDTTITAIYTNLGSGQPPNSILVKSTDSSGTTITGYYTVLMQNGATLNTAFTPALFSSLTAGQTYVIQVQDYGAFHFSHWADNGSTDRNRSVTATSSGISLVAVYSST